MPCVHILVDSVKLDKSGGGGRGGVIVLGGESLRRSR